MLKVLTQDRHFRRIEGLVETTGLGCHVVAFAPTKINCEFEDKVVKDTNMDLVITPIVIGICSLMISSFAYMKYF